MLEIPANRSVQFAWVSLSSCGNRAASEERPVKKGNCSCITATIFHLVAMKQRERQRATESHVVLRDSTSGPTSTHTQQMLWETPFCPLLTLMQTPSHIVSKVLDQSQQQGLHLGPEWSHSALESTALSVRQGCRFNPALRVCLNHTCTRRVHYICLYITPLHSVSYNIVSPPCTRHKNL